MKSTTPISIRLILDTDKEKNARTVLSRVGKAIDFELRELVPYCKGGLEATIVANSTAADWPGVVHRVIAVAQCLGSSWLLGGSIDDDIELIANEKFRFAGIQWAAIACRNSSGR